MDELIQAFIDHLQYDKEFVVYLMPQYEEQIQQLGKYIIEHKKELWCSCSSWLEELVDFIDDNGFHVIRNANPRTPLPIKIIPTYTLEEEIRYINEKLAKTLNELEETVSEYFPIQYETLSYSSMEDNKGPVLEYSELCTPRPLWICLRRRLEFLRMVSAGWGRMSALPRPP